MPKTTRPRNLRKSHDRCICGLRVSIHFTLDNRKLDCWEAAAVHQRASLRNGSLRSALIASIEKAVR